MGRRCALAGVVAAMVLVVALGATAAAPAIEAAAPAGASAAVVAPPLAPGDQVVGVASTADGDGYWLTTAAGVVHAFGTARDFGDLTGIPLTRPVVGIAATATSQGYWLVAGDGGIFSFGDAPFYGSTGDVVLNRPVVSMAPSPTGRGYWMVATDGGIFSFGDAPFHGSTGGIVLNQPIEGMTVSPTGQGYRMVAADGGIFSFGDAPFYGSTGAAPPSSPIVGMAPAPGNTGYWAVTAAGQVFAFGSAVHLGDLAGRTLPAPVVGMAAHPSAPGYLLVLANGQAARFGAGAAPDHPIDGVPAVTPTTPPPTAEPPGTAGPDTVPPSTPATSPPTGQAAYTVDASLDAGVTSGPTLPADFLGLSLEWNLVGDYVGQGAGDTSPVFVNLLRGLGPGGVLRIGGRSQDRSCYGSASGSTCDLPPIEDRQIAAVATAMRQSGWRAIYGLNMAKDDDPDHTMQRAMGQAIVALAGDVTLAAELGNEPQLYAEPNQFPGLPPPRPRGYSTADAARDFDALQADLPAALPVAGPAMSARQPLGAWFDAAPDLSRLAVLTLHIYPGHRTGTAERACTIANLLNEGVMRAIIDGSVAPAARVAAAHGERLRLGETSACSGAGVEGVTDRQAGALWTLDWLLENARAGVAGVHTHIHDPPGVGDGTARYDPIVSQRTATGYRVSVNPNYYALAMLVPALGGRVLDAPAVRVTDWDGMPADQGTGAAAGHAGQPLKLYAVRTATAAGATRTVYAVNKGTAAVDVVLRPTASTCLASAPAVVRLANPGGVTGSAAGTTLGGRRVDDTTGPLTTGTLGAPQVEQPAPRGGAVTVPVRAGEAVAITFSGCGS